jgi:hypothetical protein
MTDYSSYSNTAFGLEPLLQARQASFKAWESHENRAEATWQMAKLEKEITEIQGSLETDEYREALKMEMRLREVNREEEDARIIMRHAQQTCKHEEGGLVFIVKQIGHHQAGRVLVPSIVFPDFWWVALGSNVLDESSAIVPIHNEDVHW